MSAAVLTTYFPNYDPLAELVVPNLAGYCKKHGYDFFAPIGNPHGDAYGFQKVRFLSDYLQQNKDIDLVLCTDLDILITNYKKWIEEFVGPHGDLFITKDVNGINAGSFIVKNTEAGRKLIADILKYNGKEDNEQNAIQKHFSRKVEILPHPTINSYLYEEYGAPNWGRHHSQGNKPNHNEGQWERGDFLLHLPGVVLDRRIQIIKGKLEEVVYE